MSTNSLIQGMLAGRSVIGSANPELFAWSRQQWAAWLRSERDPETGPASPQITSVAAISGIDDLPLHIGLSQLIGLTELRSKVILSLPTASMARLAQTRARREGWGGLVQIVDEFDCAQMLCRLPAKEMLAVFPFPTVLSERDSTALAVLCKYSKPLPKGAALAGGEWFLGNARDYLAWSAAREPLAEARISAALRLILSQHPHALRLPGTAASSRRAKKAGDCSDHRIVRVDPTSGHVEVPDLAPGDELVVLASQAGAGSEIVVRVPGELQERPQRMRVRVPPGLLTNTPQIIRMDCRTSEGAFGTDLMFHIPPSRLQPWMMSAFLNRGGAGNPVIRAFAQGVGCRIAFAEDEPATLRDIPVVWGVLRDSDRIVAQAKRQGLYFFYIDHAYFNRGHGKTYRIARNGYEAGPIRDCPSARFDALGIKTLPWRKSGRDIIVCPPTEYFMLAHGCSDWLETTLSALRRVTDRPIIVREKPKPGEEAVPLPRALETAHALVTHSSNVAIESVCLGTPVFVAPASAAAPVGCTDLTKVEMPNYPDRGPWLAHLAYNQFSFEEIQDGRAWDMLRELEERILV